MCVNAAHAAVDNVTSLSHELFTSSSSGVMELAVRAAFCRASRSCPAVVFVDDIDAVAPATLNGPLDTRSVAAISSAFDNIALDADGHAGFIVLATADREEYVHPSLVRPGRFHEIITLSSPDWNQRRCMLATLMSEQSLVDSSKIFDDGSTRQDCAAHDADVDTLLDLLASATPGFMPADLVSVVSEASLDMDALLGTPRVQADVVATNWDTFCETMLTSTQRVRPSLLRSMGSAWSAIPWDEDAISKMHGLDEAISTVGACVRAALAPELFRDAVKGAVPSSVDALGCVKGLVLHGPTGSGKTALARAASSFLPRGVLNAIAVDTADIVGKVVGSSEKRVRQLFSVARASAPTVVVLENIEVIAPRRSSMSDTDSSPSSSAAAFRRLLSTLLIELDGVSSGASCRSGILFVVTTRDLSFVDPALLRPGRLEMHVSLNYPTDIARWQLLQDFCRTSAPHLLFDPPVSPSIGRDSENASSVMDSAPSWMRELVKSSAGL